MGLFFPEQETVNLRVQQEDALFHRMECRSCPLRNEDGGKIKPTGAKNPVVYIMGEAPGADEVEQQEQFVGKSGQLIRPKIPREWRDKIRWNNTVRSRPPKNRTPERPEIESCRPSVTRDIEQSKPKAIFGFGAVPLHWASGFSKVTDWRGRRMPIRVGSHECWYYPMLHPSYILRPGNDDQTLMFKMDLRRAFEEVEDLPHPVVHDATTARANIETVQVGGKEGLRLIAEALRWAVEQGVSGFDYETNGIRPYRKEAKILTAAVGTLERAIAFPVFHRESPFSPADRIKIWEMMKEDFFRKRVRKAVHNLTFEQEWTAFFGGEDLIWTGDWEDTATQASVIDSRKGQKGKVGPFSLEFLVQQYFGFNLKELTELNKKDMESEPLSKILPYNAMDAKYHHGLFEAQDAVIKNRGLDYVYELSVRRIPTVVTAQLRGIPVDQEECKVLSSKYEKRVNAAEAAIQALSLAKEFESCTGAPLNPGSNPDMIELFHKMLKRRECLKEEKGKTRLSADEEILELIKKAVGPSSEVHKLCTAILNWRHDNKRKSTYVDPLCEGSPTIYPGSLLHVNYNTYFAETGRLSCEDVNIQNWPKRDEEAKETRRPVVPRKGCKILAFDYGQIQARIIAMFSRDKAFCQSLWDRYDIHYEWAERLARAYPDRVGGKKNFTDKKIMKAFRGDVKNEWTFPLFFGAKVESAAGFLKIPLEKVMPEFCLFWKTFSGVKDWQDEEIKFYEENGYVECLTKRRRVGPLSVNKIINSPVQGTESDIVMDGMCRLAELRDPVLQPEVMVHDDLSFLSVPEKDAEDVATKVLDVLLDVDHFKFINVPITIELAAGYNWMPYDEKSNPDGLKEIGNFSNDTWFK